MCFTSCSLLSPTYLYSYNFHLVGVNILEDRDLNCSNVRDFTSLYCWSVVTWYWWLFLVFYSQCFPLQINDYRVQWLQQYTCVLTYQISSMHWSWCSSIRASKDWSERNLTLCWFVSAKRLRRNAVLCQQWVGLVLVYRVKYVKIQWKHWCDQRGTV